MNNNEQINKEEKIEQKEESKVVKEVRDNISKLGLFDGSRQVYEYLSYISEENQKYIDQDLIDGLSNYIVTDEHRREAAYFHAEGNENRSQDDNYLEASGILEHKMGKDVVKYLEKGIEDRKNIEKMFDEIKDEITKLNLYGEAKDVEALVSEVRQTINIKNIEEVYKGVQIEDGDNRIDQLKARVLAVMQAKKVTEQDKEEYAKKAWEKDGANKNNKEHAKYYFSGANKIQKEKAAEIKKYLKEIFLFVSNIDKGKTDNKEVKTVKSFKDLKDKATNKKIVEKLSEIEEKINFMDLSEVYKKLGIDSVDGKYSFDAVVDYFDKILDGGKNNNDKKELENSKGENNEYNDYQEEINGFLNYIEKMINKSNISLENKKTIIETVSYYKEHLSVENFIKALNLKKSSSDKYDIGKAIEELIKGLNIAMVITDLDIEEGEGTDNRHGRVIDYLNERFDEVTEASENEDKKNNNERKDTRDDSEEDVDTGGSSEEKTDEHSTVNKLNEEIKKINTSTSESKNTKKGTRVEEELDKANKKLDGKSENEEDSQKKEKFDSDQTGKKKILGKKNNSEIDETIENTKKGVLVHIFKEMNIHPALVEEDGFNRISDNISEIQKLIEEFYKDKSDKYKISTEEVRKLLDIDNEKLSNSFKNPEANRVGHEINIIKGYLGDTIYEINKYLPDDKKIDKEKFFKKFDDILTEEISDHDNKNKSDDSGENGDQNSEDVEKKEKLNLLFDTLREKVIQLELKFEEEYGEKYGDPRRVLDEIEKKINLDNIEQVYTNNNIEGENQIEKLERMVVLGLEMLKITPKNKEDAGYFKWKKIHGDKPVEGEKKDGIYFEAADKLQAKRTKKVITYLEEIFQIVPTPTPTPTTTPTTTSLEITSKSVQIDEIIEKFAKRISEKQYNFNVKKKNWFMRGVLRYISKNKKIDEFEKDLKKELMKYFKGEITVVSKKYKDCTLDFKAFKNECEDFDVHVDEIGNRYNKGTLDDGIDSVTMSKVTTERMKKFKKISLLESLKKKSIEELIEDLIKSGELAVGQDVINDMIRIVNKIGDTEIEGYEIAGQDHDLLKSKVILFYLGLEKSNKSFPFAEGDIRIILELGKKILKKDEQNTIDNIEINKQDLKNITENNETQNYNGSKEIVSDEVAKLENEEEYKALEDYGYEIAKNPKNESVLINMANIFAKNGKYVNAYMVLEEAVKNGNKTAQNNRLYYEKKMIEKNISNKKKG